MHTTAVIGSMFGDEGKGLMTDYCVSRYVREFKSTNGLVVRFNGGAQAGHTVVEPDGRRHVFHHFSSGTFLGVPTYLSRYFVCNPLVFLKEYKELSSKRVTPKVLVSMHSPVSTPYDMLANQIKEISRGGGRHGSCGVGFGETVGREEHGFHFTVGMLMESRESIKNRLHDIRESYYRGIQSLLEGLDLSNPTISTLITAFESEDVALAFMEDCEFFLNHVKVSDSFDGYDFLVFEGAQGLMLDMDHKNFPHVTRSKTGVTNILRMLRGMHKELDEVVYVTRAYTTRHGEGPLNESVPFNQAIYDHTNVHNEFQGSIRFATLDLDAVLYNVAYDSRMCSDMTKISLCMTCSDQLNVDAKLIHKKEAIRVVDLPVTKFFDYMSFGPTRDDVVTV